ncbi:MAG: DUF885 domain-containing protein [Candidatus Bathyarchaeota archaeon]|nr:DUF885 domain-containing protein [Candidatus Bathyarchaeota archaeon]MDH5494778.1 DUF885 domain-containing protein [Candidatus Bathyarchaeota archaeon]
MNTDEKFEELKKEIFDKFFELNPHWASHLGLHDPYDHLLPKGNTAHILENLHLLEKSVKRIKETIDYNALNDANMIDCQVLEKALEMSRFEVYEQRTHELNPDAFQEVGSTFFMMITRDYAPLEKRIDAIIARLEKLPKYLEEFRSRFKNSIPVKLWTEVAIESAQQIPGLFQFIAAASKGKIPEELHGRLGKTVMNLMQPFQEHMQWLQSLKSNTTENWALGKEKFEKLIQLRDLGMTSEEIYQLGIKYLKELKEERARIAAQIAPGKSVEEVMKTIENNAPKTFEEALKATREAMEEAKRFLIKNNIATVHEEDKLVIEQTPAFIAPLIPFAAMMMPSRFDKPMIGVYLVTRPKDTANLGSHLNYVSIKNTAVHEAFPGHFLQGTISNRSSLIHMLANGTETVEGWAHYCEQMMVEHEYVTSLESKLIQIKDVIWRAVRIIVDVKLSRGEMSFDDAVGLLMKEAGLSREGAVAEVRRYTQTPSYALSYLLGKHLILQLREEVKQKMGKKYNEKFFHDIITANGYLPISLLRKVFNQEVAKLMA